MDKYKSQASGTPLVMREYERTKRNIIDAFYGGEIYEVVGSVSSPETQAAIMSIQPTFQNLPEPVLYAYAHDDQQVGPRIGVRDVPESTLKALARVELDRRMRVANEEREKKHRKWDLVKIALAAIAGGLITWMLK